MPGVRIDIGEAYNFRSGMLMLVSRRETFRKSVNQREILPEHVVPKSTPTIREGPAIEEYELSGSNSAVGIAGKMA